MARVWDIKKLKDLNEGEKKQLLQDAYDLGFAYERDYHGCSQTAFGALQDLFGIRNDAAFKAVCGAAGGFGATGEMTCGALSGTCMFISMLYGRERDKFDDPDGYRFVAYSLCNKIYENFLKEWGSGICMVIQRKKMGGRWFRFLDPDQFKEFVAVGGHTKHAPDTVGKACMWAAEATLEKETEGK